MNWIKCGKYEDLPVGTYLVQIDDPRKPFHVAYVTENVNGNKFVVVGGHFHFDMNPLLSYTTFEEPTSNS